MAPVCHSYDAIDLQVVRDSEDHRARLPGGQRERTGRLQGPRQQHAEEVTHEYLRHPIHSFLQMMIPTKGITKTELLIEPSLV